MSELGFDFDKKQPAKLIKNVQDSYVSDMTVHSSPEKIYPASRRRTKRERVPSSDSSSDGDENIPANCTLKVLSKRFCSKIDDVTNRFSAKTNHKINNISAEINWKPSVKEAHARYVQLTLSSIVDSDFLESLQEDKDDFYFSIAKDKIMGIIETKKNNVGSTIWSKNFKDMLHSCTVIEDTSLPWLRTVKCQACQLIRVVSRKISLSDEETSDDDFIDKFQDFYVGCHCADRALLYHQLHHYSTKLEEKCNEKLSEVENTTEAADVVRSLIHDDPWLDSLFEDFENLMKEADGWMEGGEHYKRMKAAVSQY